MLQTAPVTEPVACTANDIQDLWDDLKGQTRFRRWANNDKNAQENKTLAHTAVVEGFFAFDVKEEREAAMKRARASWKKVIKDDADHDNKWDIIRATQMMKMYAADARRHERIMERLIRTNFPEYLPWLDEPSQRGFGVLGLAIILGESGDPNGYPNVAKLHKRFGVAPFYCERLGEAHMPSTWRKRGVGKTDSLTKEEFILMGYCTRRRATLRQQEEALVRQNYRVPPVYEKDAEGNDIKRKGKKVTIKPGIGYKYRACYDRAKAEFEKKETCKSLMHAHNHALGMVGRLLLTSIWAKHTGKIRDAEKDYVWSTELGWVPAE